MGKSEEDVMKRAAISGAAKALKYKDEHPNESNDQILRRVIEDLRSIIREIDRG